MMFLNFLPRIRESDFLLQKLDHQLYSKLISILKTEKKNGIEREKICSELMEKFGESNPDVKV